MHDKEWAPKNFPCIVNMFFENLKFQALAKFPFVIFLNNWPIGIKNPFVYLTEIIFN